MLSRAAHDGRHSSSVCMYVMYVFVLVQRLFFPAQSGLTTSISIITAATKPLSNSAASAQASVLHTLSSLRLCCFFFIRGLKREVNPQTNLHCLMAFTGLGSVLTHDWLVQLRSSHSQHSTQKLHIFKLFLNAFDDSEMQQNG